jgi:hypothetical protein
MKFNLQLKRRRVKNFDIAIENKFGASMDNHDFKDDPDYADFFTPTYDCCEDDELSSSKCQTLMISKSRMMLTPMTNMFEPMLGYPLGMRSSLGR